jgi:predicted RNA methylase
MGRLDQYYTNPEIAASFLSITKSYLSDNHIEVGTWIEPSAGTGSFFNLLPSNRLGYDLDPKAPGIVRADFLELQLPLNSVVIGNPPFGKNASLAVKFINHSAQFSKVIAMILPRTFRKSSLQDRLNRHFQLAAEYEVAPDAFIHEGQSYDVPCVFQIWQRCRKLRAKTVERRQSQWFSFTSAGQANCIVQRIGANAGKLKSPLSHPSPNSHYFLDASSKVKEALSEIWEMSGYDGIKYNTAGCPSIAKTELVKLVDQFMTQHAVLEQVA